MGRLLRALTSWEPASPTCLPRWRGTPSTRPDGLHRVNGRGDGGDVVANHVTYGDAMIIGGACSRPIRFVIDHRIHDAVDDAVVQRVDLGHGDGQRLHARALDGGDEE